MSASDVEEVFLGWVGTVSMWRGSERIPGLLGCLQGLATATLLYDCTRIKDHAPAALCLPQIYILKWPWQAAKSKLMMPEAGV